MFKYYIYKFGFFLANRLSLKAAYRLAIFISDLHYFLSFRDRRAVKNNLRVILSSNDNIPYLARRVFRNFGKYLVEFFRIADYVDHEFIKRKIKIVNQHYVDDVLKEGRGAICMTAHIGNWELGAVLVSLLGYPTEVIALPHKERPVNDLFNYQREIKGIKIIPSNVAQKRCIEALKNNKFLAVAADRDFSLNGNVMDFLGKKAFIPKGAAVFSGRMQSPIIPTFLIREEDDTFTLTFEKPLLPIGDGKNEEDMLDTMKKYVSIIEKKIREYPDQWLMFREFWTE